MVRCHCGAQAVVRTSWTNENPGRRFWVCCGFIDWLDPPMCRRSTLIIPGLLRSLNNHEAQIQHAMEERARMKKYLYVSWCFFIMFVVFKLLYRLCLGGVLKSVDSYGVCASLL
ncbi:hypothetical protein Tco_0561675 [Tanacetum coccineum]